MEKSFACWLLLRRGRRSALALSALFCCRQRNSCCPLFAPQKFVFELSFDGVSRPGTGWNVRTVSRAGGGECWLRLARAQRVSIRVGGREEWVWVADLNQTRGKIAVPKLNGRNSHAIHKTSYTTSTNISTNVVSFFPHPHPQPCLGLSSCASSAHLVYLFFLRSCRPRFSHARPLPLLESSFFFLDLCEVIWYAGHTHITLSANLSQ